MIKQYLLLLIAIFFCITEPQAIDYDVDDCVYCKMKISDPKFGTEVVTDKGKVYKFDSIECLLEWIKGNREVPLNHIVVTDYQNPHSFINANTAVYLISEKQASPMGGNLSAYAENSVVQKRINEIGGQMYDLEQLKKWFNTDMR